MELYKLKTEIEETLKALGFPGAEYEENGLWIDVESILTQKHGIDAYNAEACSDFHAKILDAVYMV